MDNKAADRIRPFLKAMETSIDSARQRRLKQNGGTSMQSEIAHSHPVSPVESTVTTETPRLKARPKRTPPPMVDPSHHRAI